MQRLSSVQTVTERLLEHRRRALAMGAIGTVGFLPADIVLGVPLWQSLVIRLGFAACLAVAIRLQRPERPRLADAAMYVNAVAAGVFGSLVVVTAGAAGGDRLGFLHSLPLLVLAIVPDLTAVAVICGVVSAAGGALIMHPAHSERAVLDWLLVAFTMTTLAAYASVLLRRLRAAELDVERRRAVALRRLAEAERRRAELERMAEAGRLAAEVAHEINNPLAVLKSGLAHLARAADRRDPDVDEVVADLETSLERIRTLGQKLRAVAYPAQPVEPRPPSTGSEPLRRAGT